ncbi:MAG: prepilin-type N-terminal cleavage/methylation domain-containing protein [Nannocystaceae bacterium]|nr:prepilin-type N-terminal cleavage/methylation domain-containing protein [Nannocystaceae bacterium]
MDASNKVTTRCSPCNAKVRRQRLVAARARRMRGQAGFTLMEVLVSVVVFAISVVGLVALESRAIESQKAAREIRAGQRIAQQVMAEVMSRGFLELATQDFEGVADPAFPYDDQGIDADDRMRALGLPPADVDPTDEAALTAAGHTSVSQGHYIVIREVDWIFAPGAVPPIPLVTAADLGMVNGLSIDVVVMWLDYANPTYPPPDGLQTADLTPEMIDPLDPLFRPYVNYVQLRNIRANDAVLDPS